MIYYFYYDERAQYTEMSNIDTIIPKRLKGFRDTLPPQELIRQQLLKIIRAQFECHGFMPIDTPILEYSDILAGKGGQESDKQLFRFVDQGGRDVAMRYDLTVPLARFVTQHTDKLQMPFRRYQIGKVFRGEKPQQGRFREFVQCDFDILGSENIISDYDVLQMPLATLATIIPASRLQLRFSHRDLLPSLIDQVVASTEGVSASEMRENLTAMRTIIDKIHAIGAIQVREKLDALLPNTAAKILDALMAIIQQEVRTEDELRQTNLPDPKNQMSTLLALLQTQYPDVDLIIDPSIMRGLDYYTGVIFEIYHADATSIGALSAGGRYDSLVARYRSKPLPAVGGSIGIDRILSVPTIVEQISPTNAVRALIFHERNNEINVEALLSTAHYLRKHDIAVEIYPQPEKLKQQFRYAEEKGILYGIIPVISNEGALHYEVKNLQSQQRTLCKTKQDIVNYFNGTSGK